MARGVAAQGVRRVLVFCNGLAPGPQVSAENLAARLHEELGLRMELIHADSNLGSAAGYAALLECALADPATRAVWFLDDDNVPDEGCLSRLLEVVALKDGAAVCALRRDRAYMLEAARCGRVIPARRGEAFGIDLRRAPRRIAGRLARLAGRRAGAAGTGGAENTAPVAADRTPYGGLLAPAAAARAIDPPRRDFVLYADDYDYASRLSRSAGLWIVPGAFVTDLEHSWNASGANAPRLSQTARLASMTPDFRLYYALRNALRLDLGRLRPLDWPWFALNLAWLLAASAGRAALAGRLANARCILHAAGAALRGRLGADPRYPLPGG